MNVLYLVAEPTLQNKVQLPIKTRVIWVPGIVYRLQDCTAHTFYQPMFTSGGSLVDSADVRCIQFFSWIMAVITGEQTFWLRCRDLNYLRCTVHWGKLRNGREYFHVFVFQNCHLFWTYDRISQLSYVYQASFFEKYKYIPSHTIHGTGIFTNMNSWPLWDQCRYLYTSSSLISPPPPHPR